MKTRAAGTSLGSDSAAVEVRGQDLLRAHLEEIYQLTNRRFAGLALLEWVAAIGAAVWISPHVWIATVFGGMIISLPLALTVLHPPWALTRHVIAASQMLMAGLLVHMTGGRLETHFSYFGILAFLAFYRDWRVLVTAASVAGLDHLLRAVIWPQSMYGVPSVSLWRAAEHAGWVVAEIAFLADFIFQSRKALIASMRRQAQWERVSELIAGEVKKRTGDLEDSERRYRIIFENSPLPMWLCEVETLSFLAVNQEAVRRYGYSEGEFLRMNAYDVRPPEDQEGLKSLLKGGLADKAVRQARHRKKDGTIIDVEVTWHAVEWAGVKAILVVSNDISKRKSAERAREAMEIQLRHAQKLEAIGQLASGIAHEINTPTQYIGDNLHFLKDSFRDLEALVALQQRLMPELDEHEPMRAVAAEFRAALDSADTPYLMEEIPKALDQALEGVNRVSTLVSAMKQFSHPGQTGKAPANLNEAIRSTIIVARNEWKYVAEVETHLDPLLPLVPCHVSDLNQVVLNLIVNAAHAIGDVVRDGALGKITISTRAGAEWVEIRIEDTGTGIPAELHNRIFDPFFTTKEVGKGTGQGLAISRSVVVDKHGGSIHFETELGKGTVFVVRLPLASVPAIAPDAEWGEPVGVSAGASPADGAAGDFR